jgi:hypothetical protein
VRIRITREIKQKALALTFSIISGLHLIAGFKAEIRAGLMKKEGQLTSIALFKVEAMQIELVIQGPVGPRPGAKKPVICQAISAISQDTGPKIET